MGREGDRQREDDHRGEAILRALDDVGSEALAEFRTVHLREREGLVEREAAG